MLHMGCLDLYLKTLEYIPCVTRKYKTAIDGFVVVLHHVYSRQNYWRCTQRTLFLLTPLLLFP